jgi:hypothetical protein
MERPAQHRGNTQGQTGEGLIGLAVKAGVGGGDLARRGFRSCEGENAALNRWHLSAL